MFIPDIILSELLLHILTYCDAPSLASTVLVNKRFSTESIKVITYLIKYVTLNYYSPTIFQSRYFIKSNNITFLNNLTAEKVVVIRGFISYVNSKKKEIESLGNDWRRCADTRYCIYHSTMFNEMYRIDLYSIVLSHKSYMV